MAENTTERWWEGAEAQRGMGFGGGGRSGLKLSSQPTGEGASLQRDLGQTPAGTGGVVGLDSQKELIPSDWRAGEVFYSPPHRFSSLPEYAFAKGAVGLAMSPSSIPGWGLNLLMAPVVCRVRVKPSSRVST